MNQERNIEFTLGDGEIVIYSPNRDMFYMYHYGNEDILKIANTMKHGFLINQTTGQKFVSFYAIMEVFNDTKTTQTLESKMSEMYQFMKTGKIENI